ncbi:MULTISPECIES: TetR/AcrR family transcriptional regulator [Rhodococcus erythropolis group]|uniref:TetR/AcrR family transcriptional regulator n=1 Tax=Rhodococcus qingshengii TaxID=334542 RepID=A0A2A5J3C3_RHOSG|nr:MULTISPECIES: TetR/AcrR family transcriptional regulator [Rhodococcus erythropolis group]MBO8150657.1 TetR/AcrR family transcriptional regulator [Rhodococcus erythropolis]MDO1492947.1 TetR/AcrR family transcriptional regulator [Rhodococcus erythropolis]PCK23866.1 TetR/AcrR family transcriptional regulator [Rhodococcus qingshengii]
MNNHTDRSEGIDHGKTGRPPMQPRAKIIREAILEASATLFSKTGYAGTTIDDIVTLAPVTKGAMYFHFSKKESIAREMLRRWSDAVTATVGKAIATGQPADRQVLMIYRELARRTQNEAIIRAGLILSVDQSLSGARATYEAWTAAIEPIVVDASRSGALDCAKSMSRLADTLCAGFVGAVQVAASLDENHTIGRRVDDLLLLWRGTDPAAARMVEGASL